MNPDEKQTLAAMKALGALDGDDLAELEKLLALGDRSVAQDLAKFNDLAALLAISISESAEPSADLKRRILEQVRAKESAAAPTDMPDRAPDEAAPGLRFLKGTDPAGWMPLRVPGAFVKLLSLDPERGYAVVLGRLEAGSQYPPHRHIHSEQVYVLQGDLSIGEHRMGAGDFHHADAGSYHEVNSSREGCTILAVISTEDLQAQMA